MTQSEKLEIEIKLQLESFPDYLKLIGYLGSVDGENHHVNGFFDSEDNRLNDGGWVLRVRAENDRGLVTAKSFGAHSGLAVIRQEIEAEINRGLALEILGGFSDVLDLDIEPVEYIKNEFPDLSVVKHVSFENDRQYKKYAIDGAEYVLEIDKTEFADGSVDYELEVEVADREAVDSVERQLRKVFELLDVNFEKQAVSKYERALRRG